MMVMNRIFAFMCLLIPAVCMYAQSEYRIMSYNIRNGIGIDDIMDLSRTAEVINNVCPTIVAVQEVDSVTRRSSGRYILGDLAESTGMTAIYAPAIDFDGGKYGIGILSREEPISVTRMPLPGSEEARALLMVEFKDFVFCCTHLSLTEQDRNEAASILMTISGKTKKPLFIAGDFNALPDDEVFRTLSGKFTILTDGVTPTFPSDNPKEVLDYIILSNGDNVTVHKSEVVNAPIASDHRPVLIEVTIKAQ